MKKFFMILSVLLLLWRLWKIYFAVENTIGKDGIEILGTLVYLAIGLGYILAPKGLWWLEYGRKCKGTEPPPEIIKQNRISGLVLLLLGLFILFFQIS